MEEKDKTKKMMTKETTKTL